MRSAALLAVVPLLLVGCGSAAVQPGDADGSRGSSAPAAAAPSASSGAAENPTPIAMPRRADLLPPRGRAWFGMNLDWGSDTIAGVSERLGATPAAWVQFVQFPLDAGGRGNLAAFYEQVGAVGGIAVVTLEPHAGLSAVTEAAATELAAVLDDAWARDGVPTLVRFAHEMNGSWYPWGHRPEEYVAAFRTVAEAVHAGAPDSAMAWAPNEGAGYPFPAGRHRAAAGSEAAAALDTDGDGALSAADDPYAPYWPGADAVDWVGMSLYFWGLEYPWGENEVAPAGRFAALLRGDGGSLPDFYATYADGHGKPVAIFETAALYDPAIGGPTEETIKRSWFEQVFSADTRASFPRLGMINWFEWRKDEPEVGTQIDWRLTSDPALARDLLDGAPEDWLLYAGE